MKWEQQRKKDIEKFKKEIINSDLFVNLKNNFGEDIDEDKIMVIDHEEWKQFTKPTHTSF